MASQSNILKMLSSLGGGASEGYGSFAKQGGQPILPKPATAMPHALSPYAPGNQGGGPFAGKGNLLPGAYGADSFDSSRPSKNSTAGVQRPEMRESPSHPIAQLAQYLTTSGAHPAARLKKYGTDPGAFLRGGGFRGQQ